MDNHTEGLISPTGDPMEGGSKFVSVIIPCREEEKYIARTLESILANDYPQDRLELLVVDGMSTDGTREIVAEFCRKYPVIKLLDNPKRITPAALNIGISAAQGDIIMRVDAHGVIPPNYISDLVAWQEKTGADNVGGGMPHPSRKRHQHGQSHCGGSLPPVLGGECLFSYRRPSPPLG